MYISKKTKIDEWVITKKKHESAKGIFTKGSKVKVVEIDDSRGYTIEDEYGNRMCEIGWEI